MSIASKLTSIESLEQFCRLVLETPELREQFQSCPDQESLVRLAVALGRDNGFDITPEDVMRKIEEATAQQEVTYPIEDLSIVATY